MSSSKVPSQLEVGLSYKNVQDIIEEANEKSLVLPDFQRDFVWPTKQVGKLLESLLNGYYINTLLTLPVMRGREEEVPFPAREIEGVSNKRDPKVQMDMVLDGQQRVTSIYYALIAPKDIALSNTKYPQLYCLRLEKAIDGVFDGDAVTWRRRDWSTSQELVDNDYGLQIKKGLIPFTVFESSESFESWMWGMIDYVEENDVAFEGDNGARSLSRDEIKDVRYSTAAFRNYDVPIIQMKAGTKPAKVVQTFERINTQGLALGIFDILTARLWPDSINLRDLWDDAVENHEQLENYVSKVGVTTARERTLKTLALYRNQECGEESLGQLDPAGFEEDWNTAVQILDRTLKKARKTSPGGFGVSERFGFPYGSILPPLANLIHTAENSGSYPDKEALRKIRRWYWASIFSQRYSGSSDTTSFKDCNTVQEWITEPDAEQPVAIREARRLIPVETDLMTLTQGGAYKGVMSLMILNNARDFGSLEGVSVHEVDDHHIFPKSKLKDGTFGEKYSQTERNRILNRTIIQSESNRFRYGDRAPSNYVREMIEGHSGDKYDLQKEVLEDHFINLDGMEAMLNDDYEAFCEAREDELERAIERRTGLDLDWGLTEDALS